MGRRVWEFSMGPTKPLGHNKVTVSSSAVSLPSIPAGVKRVVIRTLGQAINWRDDGTDPTSSVGMALLADETLVFDGDAYLFRMIRSSGSDADVRVAYYSNDE
jgi:hypothetical protein